MNCPDPTYDAQCQRCSRLVSFLAEVKQEHPGYFCRPVPSFGEPDAPLVVVGLAPGLHGANASGRPFTGDHAGILLYQTLHDYGWTSAPESVSVDDGLRINGARITNAVKCLPPGNKPTGVEIRSCNAYLSRELAYLPPQGVIVALGRIAHEAVLRALDLRPAAYHFAHGAEHELNGMTLIDSYHCSRYNTQTKRLTTPMFRKVFARARQVLEGRGLMPT